MGKKKLFVSYIGEDCEINMVMGKCTELGALRAMRKFEHEYGLDVDEMVSRDTDNLQSVSRIVRYVHEDYPDTEYFSWDKNWGEPYPEKIIELIDEAPGWIARV